MAVAKSIEVISSSTSGIDDAVRSGIAKVGETVNGIQGAWVKGTKVVVQDNAVTEWRVTLKVTFLVA
jgi:flavin-binding protein dodecin